MNKIAIAGLVGGGIGAVKGIVDEKAYRIEYNRVISRYPMLLNENVNNKVFAHNVNSIMFVMSRTRSGI